MTTAPTRAVPSDEPRFWAVYWSPPTSLPRSTGADETITLPSWDAIAPMPAPMSRKGRVVMAASAPSSRRAASSSEAASMSSRPACTTRRGDARGSSLGTAGAVTTSASESGSILTPVSNASSPRQSERNSGIAKNIPIITRYCMSSTDSPTLSWRLANSDGSTSGEAPLAARWRCQATNASSSEQPADDQPGHRRDAQQRRRRVRARRRRAAAPSPSSPTGAPRTRAGPCPWRTGARRRGPGGAARRSARRG